MRRNARFPHVLLSALCLLAAASVPAEGTGPAGSGAGEGILEMSFMKGDARNGSRVHLRIAGDSLFYRETVYAPGTAPVETGKRLFLHGQRRRALLGVQGELPRYPAFGTCFGKDMSFYMVETGAGRFYRSLPGIAGKCYADEPGIWSLFRHLDDLLAPPVEQEYQEPSAS